MSFKNIVSIHGTPRSGTSWLGQIIDSSPDVVYKFQPLFSYAFKDEISLDSNKKDLMKYYSKLYNYNDPFLNQLDKKNKGIYPEFNKKNSIPSYIATKMVRYHYLVPHLLKELEEAYIISIIRNPCAVLNSWRKAPREFHKDWDFNQEWRFAQSMNNFRPEQYYGFNKWKESTKLFLEMKKKYSNRVYIIKYENLVNSPIKLSKEIYNFVGLVWNKQTNDFILDSTSKEDEDEYSVYKGDKNLKEWENQLDENIIGQVCEELKDTEFERFLN